MISIEGKITRGRGLAKSTTIKEVDYLINATQLQIMSGTVNLVTKNPISLRNENLELFYKYPNGRQKDFLPAILNGKIVYLTRWKNCPLHIFEIFSDEKIVGCNSDLGDDICLFIDKKYVKSTNIFAKLYWHAIWYRREAWWYQNNFYWRSFRLIFIKNVTGHS